MITQTACLALRQIGQRPNSTIDDRDAGLVETPAGSILVTHFTSLVTVWYEVLLGSLLAQLRQARWRNCTPDFCTPDF